jgi:hypothetical protein
MKIKEMRINWKVLLALVLIVGVSYLAVNSIFPRSYSGSALNFAIGSGTVTVTNPSTESIPAQLVGNSGSYRVSSAIEGLSESPTRERTATSAIYLLEFELPPGETEFSLTRGTNVSFVTTTETQLEATVLPASVSSARTTVVVAAVVVLGSLFYISRAMGHPWIHMLRRPKTSRTNLIPVAEGAVAGPGQGYRPYGDNRAKTGD